MARPRNDPARTSCERVFRDSECRPVIETAAAARKAGLSAANTSGTQSVQGRVVVRKTQEADPALLAELNRIGVNLNQIAHKANATGRFDATEIEATRQKLEAALLKAMEALEHGPGDRQ